MLFRIVLEQRYSNRTTMGTVLRIDTRGTSIAAKGAVYIISSNC
jgi:hypothetical protein